MQRILLTYQWLGDFNYAKAKIFDGFESLIIYENYGKCNTFELDVPFSFENNSIFKPENIFKFDGVYYYVDDVSGTSDKLKVCGKSLAGKYDSRIIDRTYIASKSPALIAWDHINQEIINPGNYSDINGSYNGADRKIDYLTLSIASDLGLQSIDYQNSYGEVQKQVETLCETYNFGFKEVGEKGVVSNQIQFFKGRDVSKWVVFSDDSDGYENLNEVEFEHSTFDKKTVAYAFGEGEGSDRKKIVLNPTIKGLSRRELYVDARDLQSSDGTTTIPSATYNNMLKDRANQSLADKKEVITLNGDFVLTSKLVQFGRDFFVGDTVRLTSKRYGAAKTAVISQAKKTYNDKGEYLELIYDKETPTIFDILGRNK
ncbi:siphovirus ReqiPepy6 Gp37-like family protein [Lactococcus lactis]|uniref:siphovirus ReqiPepy6 Gp37-like family protein n=1 Tax=Lactococcus lactis TaxID=1358 RepID=UPI002072B11C|nr:siphovirus ReqiPepy6 Gp37-like family protein [Lactococcus lactis]